MFRDPELPTLTHTVVCLIVAAASTATVAASSPNIGSSTRNNQQQHQNMWLLFWSGASSQLLPHYNNYLRIDAAAASGYFRLIRATIRNLMLGYSSFGREA